MAEYIHVFWDCSLFSTHFPSWTLAGKKIYVTITFNRNNIAEKDKLYVKSIVNVVSLKNEFSDSLVSQLLIHGIASKGT